MIVTTTEGIPGQLNISYIGLVSAHSVQSKSLFSDFGSSLKSIVGGKLRAYEKMIEAAKQQALEQIKQKAESMGADAIVGLKIATTNTTMQGSAEVIFCGTAVKINK